MEKKIFYFPGLEITGCTKTLNESVFSYLRLISYLRLKNACAYFSKCTKIVPFFLCPVPKYVFSVFNFSLFRSYAAGSYNSTGLSVLLVLNHRSFVQDRKPVVRITHVLMFDVLSNEKSRKSRRGFLTC
jgi:hypothetical protein